MYFDGSDDYISVPYVDELDENEITISTWIKPMYSENYNDMRYITATSNEWFSMGINPRDDNSKLLGGEDQVLTGIMLGLNAQTITAATDQTWTSGT